MRKRSDLSKDWKVPVNAVTAGKVEMALTDPLTQRPKYGARTILIERLLDHWLDLIAGKSIEDRKPMPSLEELRSL